MKSKLGLSRSIAVMATTSLLLGALPFASAQAATTGFLNPEDGTGTYTDWANSSGGGANVNDQVGCGTPDSTTFWFTDASVQNNDRATAVVDISTIPDNSLIESVNIRVCDSSTGGAILAVITGL